MVKTKNYVENTFWIWKIEKDMRVAESWWDLTVYVMLL